MFHCVVESPTAYLDHVMILYLRLPVQFAGISAAIPFKSVAPEVKHVA